MTRRPASINVALDALYAELPAIECKGKCHDSCGPIDMTRPERRRIAEHGVDIPAASHRDGPMDCPALTFLNRCAVYEVRPAICRIWGLTRALQCSYGCVPDGGFLTESQAYEFLARVFDLGGDPGRAAAARQVAAQPDLERKVRHLRRSAVDEMLAEKRMPDLLPLHVKAADR